MVSSHEMPALPTGPGHVAVQLLDGGSFTANLDVVHAGSLSVPYRCYSWVFYIYHEPSDRHIIWDVGISAVSRASPSPRACHS